MKIKSSFIVLIVILGGNVMSCTLFAGILYPKYYYSFIPMEEQIPGTAQERLEKGVLYPQNFTFFINQGANNFKSTFLTNLFINKRYHILNLKEMSIEWDENAKILLSDKKYILSIDDFITNNIWYWGYVQDFYSINFEKLFKEKKVGDTFLLRLKLLYSFDNEEEKEQRLEYNVVVTEGRYISPFMGR